MDSVIIFPTPPRPDIFALLVRESDCVLQMLSILGEMGQVKLWGGSLDGCHSPPPAAGVSIPALLLQSVLLPAYEGFDPLGRGQGLVWGSGLSPHPKRRPQVPFPGGKAPEGFPYVF